MLNNNLPPDWSWIKLGDVATLIRGVSYKKDLASKLPKQNYLPIVRATNINSTLHFDDLVYVPKALIKVEQFIRNGDIVIAMSSGSKDLVGKAAQAQSDSKIAFGTFCGLVRFNSEKVYSKFFGFYFHSKTYRDHISKVSMGVNINNLRREHIEELEIPLPPLPEQKKIVEKIEELFSGLDSGVASLQKAKEQIKLYRQSVLAAAFSGRLIGEGQKSNIKSQMGMLKAAEPKVDYGNDGLPEGWKWGKLGEVVDSIRYGTSKKCFYEKAGKPVLRIPNIVNGYINDDELKYSEFNKDEIKELSLNENDILIIRSNGSLSIVGKTAIVSNKYKGYLYAGYLIRIRLKVEFYNSKFLNLLFSSNQLRNQIEFKAKSTSGVNNINAQEIQALDIPLPPLTQQSQIVEEIEKRFSEADNLEKAIDDSLEKSEALRQSILKKAFEGKLV